MCCLWETREDMEVKHGSAMFADKSFSNSGLFLFFSSPEQWEDGAALLPAAQCWSLPVRRMGPSARLSAAVHHPARAEVGLGVTLSTAPSSTWPGHW